MEAWNVVAIWVYWNISEKMLSEGSALNLICEETRINPMSCVAHHVHLRERKLVLKKNQELLVRLDEISCLLLIGFWSWDRYAYAQMSNFTTVYAQGPKTMNCYKTLHVLYVIMKYKDVDLLETNLINTKFYYSYLLDFSVVGLSMLFSLILAGNPQFLVKSVCLLNNLPFIYTFIYTCILPRVYFATNFAAYTNIYYRKVPSLKQY